MAEFLSNKHSGKDLFDEQPQEKIASAIAEVIKNDASARRIIGLEGEWGSGKSNVVGILQDKLKEYTVGKLLSKQTTRYKYLVYDLWTHQTDNVRKTLLLSFVKELCNDKILSNDWENQAKRLLSTRTENEHCETPHFGIGLVCFATAIIITSIYALLKTFCPESKGLNVALIILYMIAFIVLFNIGCNLISQLKRNFNKGKLSPVWIWHWNRWKNSVYNWDNYLCLSLGNAFAKSFHLFVNKQVDKTSEDYHFELITTADGYQSKIKEIDKKIVAAGYHYIIVLDNFDRVQQEKVRELWATLITLFGEAQYHAITILVPFERTHVQEAFKHGDNECEAEDFINKTFSCVFRAAQPTMSTWKRFFAEKWEKAFGVADNGDIQMLFELLEPHITPRSIIAFINKVVTIQLWADQSGLTIPHKYMALYALQQKEIVKDGKVVDNILNETYLGNADFLFKDDVEVSRYILGLHYQLNPQKALDIIFVSRLRKAFDENLKGAEVYLGMENWRQLLQSAIKEVNNVPQTALMLGELLKAKTGEDTTQLWDALYGRLNSKEKNYKEYQKAFYLNISESKRRTYLGQIVDNYHPTKEELKSDDFNSAEYIKSLQALKTFVLTDDNLQGCFKPVELSPVKFLDSVAVAGDKIWYYKVTCPEDKLDEYLAGLDETKYSEINYLPYLINNGYKLENFKQELYHKIQNHIQATIINQSYNRQTTAYNNVDPTAIVQEQNLLKYFGKPLGPIFSPGFLSKYYPHISEKETNDFHLSFLAQLILHETNAANEPLGTYDGDPFNNVVEDNVHSELATILPDHVSLGKFLSCWLKFKGKPLVVGVVKHIINNRVVVSDFDLVKFSKSFDSIKAATSIDEIKLMQFADFNVNDVNPEITFEIDNVVVKLSMLHNEIPLCNKIINASHLRLNDIGVQDWNDYLLESDDPDVVLLKTISDKITLPANLLTAFKTLVVGKVKEGTTLDADTTTFVINKAIKEKRSLTSLAKNLCDEYLNNRATINIEQFKLYGALLLTYGSLHTSKDSLRLILKPEILADSECQKIILAHEAYVYNVYMAALPEEQEDFNNNFSNLVKKWEEEVRKTKKTKRIKS